MSKYKIPFLDSKYFLMKIKNITNNYSNFLINKDRNDFRKNTLLIIKRIIFIN